MGGPPRLPHGRPVSASCSYSELEHFMVDTFFLLGSKISIFHTLPYPPNHLHFHFLLFLLPLFFSFFCFSSPPSPLILLLFLSPQDLCPTLLPLLSPSILRGLQDVDDDVRAVAASSLLPVANQLVAVLPSQVFTHPLSVTPISTFPIIANSFLPKRVC